jgi:hypothetical protein
MALLSQLPGRRVVIALWAVLLLFLGLSVTPWIVGSFLGDEYTGEQSSVIARSPAEVWERVMDHERYPVNSTAVMRVLELESENGLPAWEEEMNRNSALIWSLALDEERRVQREMKSLDGQMVTLWDLSLEPVSGGTRVVLRQDVTISAIGMIGAHLRFVMRFMNNAEVGPRLYLARLKQELEAEGGTE